MLEAQLTSDIPIVEQFCYSGIEIHPNLETTITKKIPKLQNSAKGDDDKWFNPDVSLASRFSMERTNTLPEVNGLCQHVSCS